MNSNQSHQNNYDPHAEYSGKFILRRNDLNREKSLSRRFWILRRIDFALIAVSIVLAFDGWISPLWIIPFVAIFIILMALHQRVLDAIKRLERSIKFYQRGIERLEDRWSGKGSKGEKYLDNKHSFAEDLDLFGEGSLFDLISSARTKTGEDCLAGWLLEPAEIPEIRARQEAIEELRMRTDLREDLYTLGEEVESGVRTDILTNWAGSKPIFTSIVMPVSAAIIGALTLAAVILWFGFGYRMAALAALIVELIFYAIYRARVAKVISSVEQPGRELELLAKILGRIECEQFSSEKLMSLRQTLETGNAPPSVQIARLARLIQILDSIRNQFFAPIAFVLAIVPQLAFGIDRWRQKSGAGIPQWIEAIGEIEALCSLAGYAYEHPQDKFPEIVESGPCFEGEQIGHPLIQESKCIRNDVKLGKEPQMLIISGSNMSGKSTLMRTVGVNVVLALAGAPVKARQLRLSPLAIGSSMHILDSIQAGASRFYAEISRLRQILDLTNGRLPLLFLLDEILSGTNSHDRRIGAEAVVKTLVERGAIGLITTHDLALTHIADPLGNKAINVHFEDRIEDGKIIFDYTMRDGIVQRSNALELMRSVGLDV